MSLQCIWESPWSFLNRGTGGRGQHKSSAAQKVSEGRSVWLRQSAWISWLETVLQQGEIPGFVDVMGCTHRSSPRQSVLEEESRITGAAVVLNYQHRGSPTRTIRTFKGTWWECHQLPERTTKTE